MASAAWVRTRPACSASAPRRGTTSRPQRSTRGPTGTLNHPSGPDDSAIPAGDEREALSALVARLPAHEVRAVAAAEPATAFGNLPEALHEALQTADVASASPDPAARPVWRPRHLGVRGLVWRLRNNRHLLSYVDEQIGPLLRLPEERRTGLLQTLRAYVETDGVVTAFAARIGTSRPAAYARIRKLSEVLDRNLDDPPTRLSVYLALLTLDQSTPGVEGAAAPYPA